MTRLRSILIAFILVLPVWTLSGQSVRVSGKVVGNDGVELIGVGVQVKGVPGGAVTGLDGNYSIEVADPSSATLVYTCLGMQTQELRVNSRKVINVTMEPDAVMLDEVVAIGYATMKRRDLTGSVASVGSEELSKVPVSDVTQALAGRMAGVQVLSSEGSPDASISIRVRGGISITQSNEPLYIVDGFPTEDGLASLDPAEIETIDILKDASSTAIYGARGANGVVVVTTKSGSKRNRTDVTFDSYVGVRKIAKKLDVLSPYEFVLADYERSVLDASSGLEKFENKYGAFADINKNYANRPGIDWQEETLGRTALVQNYRVGVNGTSDRVRYNMAYSYYDEEGAMVYSGVKKHNISFSLNHKVNKRLTVTARLSYDQRKVTGMGTSGDGSSGTGDRFNKMQHILQYRPTYGIKGDDSVLLKGEDPALADDSGNVMQNPLLSASEETKDRTYRTIQANGGFTFNLAKGLSFKNTTGMRYQTRRFDIFFGDQSVTAKRTSINGSIQNTESGSFQTSNVLTYNLEKGDHSFTAMAGQEWVSAWTTMFKASATNFPNDEIGLNDLSLGIAAPGESSVNFDDKLLSFFTRVNYSFRDKYIISASFRADGSSKFGKNNKWGYFPAVSAAWRMIDEPWIKDLGVFSDLKFHIGYGLAGNNRIASYSSLAVMDSVTYPLGDGTQSGYASKQIPNPFLKWEANKTFNAGLDLGFFNQRLVISPEVYVNRSSNLLLDAKLPDSSGYTKMVINAGETENKGIDLTVSTINVAAKNFTWRSSLTLSHNVNKVVRLTGEKVQYWEAAFGYSQNTHQIGEGQPLGQFFGFETDGIYQVGDFDYTEAGGYVLKDGIAYRGDKNQIKPGNWKFKNTDKSEDNQITDSDRTVIGNALPILYGGFNNTFVFKNLDLSVYFTYSYGNDILNATKLTNARWAQENRNALAITDRAHRFTYIDDAGNVVKDPAALSALNQGKTYAGYYDSNNGAMYIHSWAVEDGSYLKLSNVTLGYTLPSKLVQKVGINKLRAYVTGTNLYTFTKYTGLDPEVSTMSSYLTPGVDFGAYPRSRSVVFGVNVTF